VSIGARDEPSAANLDIFRGASQPPCPQLSMAAEPVARKLAAGLIADLAGYSRMSGKVEEKTSATSTSFAIRSLIPRSRNIAVVIVKTMGDGILIEFAKIVDAIACSLDVQRGSAARNEKLRSANRMNASNRLTCRRCGGTAVRGPLGDAANIPARLDAVAHGSRARRRCRLLHRVRTPNLRWLKSVWRDFLRTKV
jgi:class 3 adenylate cyclase